MKQLIWHSVLSKTISQLLTFGIVYNYFFFFIICVAYSVIVDFFSNYNNAHMQSCIEVVF